MLQSNPRAERAQEWLVAIAAKLEKMPLDDRLLWRATKPAGEQVFNYRKLDQALTLNPHMRRTFVELGAVS